jgi:hypothetical protein
VSSDTRHPQPEEIQPDESGSKPIAAEDAPKTRRALARLKRELSDEELSHPGVQKLLLDTIERTEEENVALRSFRERYHESDKQYEVLKEKLKTHTALDVISMGCMALGGTALGYARSLWASQPAGLIALISGAGLFAMGITAKVVRR